MTDMVRDRHKTSDDSAMRKSMGRHTGVKVTGQLTAKGIQEDFPGL